MFKYLGRSFLQKRTFRSYPALNAITPFKLADIGEGISEVEVIQWYS
jgi:hypothetical protein